MEHDNEISQELKEISPFLSQLENKSPYQISSFYFNNLSEVILTKIKAEDEDFPSLVRINPYAAPAGYFDNFSNNIIKKINLQADKNEVFEEMEEISPILNTISKQPIYSVPPNFFDQLNPRKEAIVVKRSKILYFSQSKKILTYTIAAIIIGLLTVGIFLFTGKQRTPSTAANVQTLPEVNRLSEQEIVDFLKTTSPTESIVISNSNSNKKDVDIKRMVDEISDKEIQQFLEENGEKNEM